MKANTREDSKSVDRSMFLRILLGAKYLTEMRTVNVPMCAIREVLPDAASISSADAIATINFLEDELEKRTPSTPNALNIRPKALPEDAVPID